MDDNQSINKSNDGVSLIQMQYGERIMVTVWTKDIENLRTLARRFFDIHAEDRMKLIPDLGTEKDPTPDSAWKLTESIVSTIQVITDHRDRGFGPMTVYANGIISKEVLSLQGGPSTTIGQLKLQIWDALGRRENQQAFELYNIPSGIASKISYDKPLEDERQLAHYEIKDQQTIYFVPATVTRANWNWPKYLLQRKETLGPFPKAQLLASPEFVNEDVHLVLLRYRERQVVTSWDEDFAGFQSKTRQLLNIPEKQSVRLSIQLPIFGDSKMEVDPNTWPSLEGLLNEVWISDV